jgi:hypothetical protein
MWTRDRAARAQGPRDTYSAHGRDGKLEGGALEQKNNQKEYTPRILLGRAASRPNIQGAYSSREVESRNDVEYKRETERWGSRNMEDIDSIKKKVAQTEKNIDRGK